MDLFSGFSAMGWAALPVGHYLLMVAAWISLFVYIMIASVIFINRIFLGLFKNAFFTLVIAQAIPELIMILLIELRLRPVRFGLFTEPADPHEEAQFYVWLQTALRGQIILAYIPFALNRFTAFYKPVAHKHIWTTSTTLILVGLTWIAPMALASINSVAPGGSAPNTDGFLVTFSSIQAQAITTITFVVCLPLYIFAFAYARRRIVASKHIKRQDIMQLACSLITFTTIVFDFGRNVMQIVGDVKQDTQLSNTAEDLWFYSTELMCIVQPWAVLMTNVLLRKHIRFLCRRKKMVFPTSSTGDLFHSTSHGTNRGDNFSAYPTIEDDPPAVNGSIGGGTVDRRPSMESARLSQDSRSTERPPSRIEPC